MLDLQARVDAVEARVAALEGDVPRLPLTLARVRQEARRGLENGRKHGATHWAAALDRIVAILDVAERDLEKTT